MGIYRKHTAYKKTLFFTNFYNIIFAGIVFLDFAIENYSEMFGYIATGRINIRIHWDIEGPPNNPSDKQDVVWDGVDIKKQVYTPAKYTNLLAYINLL